MRQTRKKPEVPDREATDRYSTRYDYLLSAPPLQSLVQGVRQGYEGRGRLSAGDYPSQRETRQGRVAVGTRGRRVNVPSVVSPGLATRGNHPGGPNLAPGALKSTPKIKLCNSIWSTSFSNRVQFHFTNYFLVLSFFLRSLQWDGGC